MLLRRTALLFPLAAACIAAAQPVEAASRTRAPARVESLSADDAFMAARDAFRAGDSERLAMLAERLKDYPLAAYVEFWQLQPRLRTDDPAQVDAAAADFLARHAGTYIADRLRLEWLLALGARGDYDTFLRERPALVWNTDAQIDCYAMLARYVRDGRSEAIAQEGRQLLARTRESASEGCTALADALLADDRLPVWERLRALVEQNQLATARRMAINVKGAPLALVVQAIDKPALFLATHERRVTEAQRELALIAVARLARDDPAQAARFGDALNLHLTPQQRGLMWGRIGHMAALKLAPEAIEWYRRGGEQVGVAPGTFRADEVLEWQVRAALRGDRRGPDWRMVRATIERMPPALARAPAWVYWHARALQAEKLDAGATELLHTIAGRFDFYGKLAAEEIGRPIVIPPRAAEASPEEVAALADNPGFARALVFYRLGLRAEGHREWNWQLRGMTDRQLLAAAEYARSVDVLDRMIATSERTRAEFDFTQRFPAPHWTELMSSARAAGLDETWVYGLIRQESRFIQDIRSNAGAQGLMQLMPATARYVARKFGMNDFAPARINEVDVNLRLGTGYLRMVLDDLDGDAVLATAAYNAGPGRARLWRSTLARPVEGAIFAETIPFNETREYVKHVMSNAVYYAALFENKAQSLKERLGTITPKAAGATDLP
jgi:soluble lytic murein transglycosylase